MGWIWIWLAASAAAAAAPPAESPRQFIMPPSPMAAQQAASIAQQRASVRKQAQNLSVWMVPWADAAPGADLPAAAPSAAAPAPCEPIADDVVAPLIDSAAKLQDIEPKLVRAMIERESAFRPCAVSPKGAQGLMQLMPDTAQEFQLKDPFEPGANIQAGARYLKQLLDKYKGDMGRALAAYNAGPNAVDQAGGIPEIPETREYVNAILEKLGLRPAAKPP